LPPTPSSPPFPYTTLFRSPAVEALRSLAIEPKPMDRSAGACAAIAAAAILEGRIAPWVELRRGALGPTDRLGQYRQPLTALAVGDRKSTRLNSSHVSISYA